MAQAATCTQQSRPDGTSVNVPVSGAGVFFFLIKHNIDYSVQKKNVKDLLKFKREKKYGSTCSSEATVKPCEIIAAGSGSLPIQRRCPSLLTDPSLAENGVQ